MIYAFAASRRRMTITILANSNAFIRWTICNCAQRLFSYSSTASNRLLSSINKTKKKKSQAHTERRNEREQLFNCVTIKSVAFYWAFRRLFRLHEIATPWLYFVCSRWEAWFSTELRFRHLAWVLRDAWTIEWCTMCGAHDLAWMNAVRISLATDRAPAARVSVFSMAIFVNAHN